MKRTVRFFIKMVHELVLGGAKENVGSKEKAPEGAQDPIAEWRCFLF